MDKKLKTILNKVPPQLLWEDIAKDQEYEVLPPDHKLILNERLEKIYEGKGEFKSREEIRKKYQNT